MDRVGWGFIALYALAFMGTCLVLIAPLLVTLALKVNSLVGIDQAPQSLSLVTGVGALVAMFGNPLLGKISDRTTSRLGMRRPWMAIGLVGGTLGVLLVAVAPNVPVVLVGWCIAQLFFNGLLAAMVAVLPDQVPVTPARPGLRRPGRLPARRVGRWHLRRPAVQRQPAGDVPRAVRDRRPLHRPFAVRLRRPAAGAGGPAGLVAAGAPEHVLRRPAAQHRTSPGPSPAASCSSRPTRSW